MGATKVRYNITDNERVHASMAAIPTESSTAADTGLTAEQRSLPRRLAVVAKRVWQRGIELELMHRALAFAALGFVTLVPLLIIVAAADPLNGGGFAGWVVDGLGVSGHPAAAVRALFSSPRRVLSTTTALSLASVAFFGLSFMAAVQTGYERIWDLPSASWHDVWRRPVALAGLIGYLLAAAESGSWWPHAAPQPALRMVVTIGGCILFFWWYQHLLLGGRVGRRALLPGALATTAALVGLRAFSSLVFSPLIASGAADYGTIGTVLIVQSWLIGVGFTVFAGALVGQVLWHERHRGPG